MALVVIAWVLVLVVVPVVTGAIAAPAPPESALDESLLPETFTLPEDSGQPLGDIPTDEGSLEAEPTMGFLEPGSGVIAESTPEAGGSQ